MTALELTEFAGVASLRVVRKPVPVPGPGQVLIRVLASPVNPSDVMFCRGLYGIDRTLPTTPGFEGCGVVVAGGGGWLARRLVGKRVACGSQGSDGLWAEYAVMPAMTCLPLPARISDEQGASALVNPVSAWAMFDQFRRSGSPALIQTAAASQLGRMVLRLGVKHRGPIIHIVHRPALVDLLRGMGAEHVLDSSAEGFDAALHALAQRLHATYAIDAVGGDLTRRVLAAMPEGTLVVYGALAGAACQVDPRDLIFRNKRLTGFWLSAWLRSQNPLLVLWRLRPVLAMLDQELATEVAVRLSLQQAPAELEKHLASTSKGKILLVPPGV
jgi:NADPH:quinone reductase-like Zn-dependent oxidoreductase